MRVWGQVHSRAAAHPWHALLGLNMREHSPPAPAILGLLARRAGAQLDIGPAAGGALAVLRAVGFKHPLDGRCLRSQ